MTNAHDVIKVFHTEYRLSTHARIRMKERHVTLNQIRDTLEDGSCQRQTQNTDICVKDFWDDENKVSKEVKVIVDRVKEEIVTVIAN